MNMPAFTVPVITCAMTPVETDESAASDGLWRLNAGTPMTMCLWGVNHDPVDDCPQPFRLVVDWATARFAHDRLHCFWNHWEYDPIGYWDELAIDAATGEATGRLHLIREDGDKPLFHEAARARVLLDSGVPLEASIGSDPRLADLELEEIAPGELVEVNGKAFQGSAELPLFIWRQAVIAEASLCMHGRDADTGKIAASAHNSQGSGDVLSPGRTISSTRPERIRCATTDTKEHDMSDKIRDRLARLLAAHDEKHTRLIATAITEGKEDDEIENEIAAADADEKDKRIEELETQLAAAQTENEELKAAAADETDETPDAATTDDETDDKVAASAKASHKVTASATDDAGDAQPKTYPEACKVLASEGSKATGFAQRRIIASRWPKLCEPVAR